jgi:hypothetical protein
MDKEADMPGETTVQRISDATNQRNMDTDLNGAGTAVGTRHPENRPHGQSIPAINLPTRELDDYDDDKQPDDLLDELPPDQDVGESFPEITEVGDKMAGGPRQASGNNDVLEQLDQTPTVDNQTGQPRRFHNPRQGPG